MKTVTQVGPPLPVVCHSDTSHDVFVARQPIFDRHLRVYGYELLFRSGGADLCAAPNDTDASRQVMSAAWIDLGMKVLVGDKLAFVNFTRDLFLSGAEVGLLSQSTVIEVLETIEPDDDVVRACAELKQSGYRRALDDFEYRPDLEPLISLVDIVKIRFGECDPKEQCQHVRRVAPYAALLAETLTGRALKGSHLTYLKLIEAVGQKDLDLGELDRAIRADVSLTHRFLRFIGSAVFG